MEQRIAYDIVTGDGVPIVFVHGWLGDRNAWTRVDTHLDVPNPKLYYDQRCHGDSFCTRFDSLQELAGDLYRLVMDCGLEDPVIVGHSLGGMVALTYAALYDELAGVSVLCAGARTPELRARSLDDVLEGLETMDRETWAEEMVENYVPEGRNDPVRTFMERRIRDAGTGLLRDSLQAVKRYDVRDALTDLTVPVQVIGGEKDEVIPAESIREAAGLLGCDPVWVDASHMVLYDAPGRIATELGRFVRQV